jgi:LmbE family N-acetylglucosaminyl deacetylase
MQDRPFDPDIVVDITEVMDLKEQAILAFSSQFNVENPQGEPTTYISRPDFFRTIQARARHYGHLGGCTYGEPFLYYNKPIPVNDLGLFLQSKPPR